MIHTITFTPKSLCNYFNRRFDKTFTVNQIKDNWDGITNYIDNWASNGLMSDSLWEDFMAVAEEWEIDLFDDDDEEQESTFTLEEFKIALLKWGATNKAFFNNKYKPIDINYINDNSDIIEAVYGIKTKLKLDEMVEVFLLGVGHLDT